MTLAEQIGLFQKGTTEKIESLQEAKMTSNLSQYNDHRQHDVKMGERAQ